jgi:outer membrane protein assembly factor BamE
MTMLTMRKAYPLLLSVLLASGCAMIYRQPVFQGTLLEKANVDQLKEGLTRAQVQSLLGTPPLADPFHAARWDYTASEQRGHHRPVIKTLTVYFENDQVVRWEGDYFPEEDTELVKEMARFGNLPKDKDKKGSGH